MLHHTSQLRAIRLNDYNTLFYFEIESHVDFGPLISKDHKLYHKIHVDCVFSECTGCQPLVSGSASDFLLKTYDLILDILLFHNTKHIHNYNMFDMTT
jgi:hypothetical protein